MDKLFSYTSEEMMDVLKPVEQNMRKACYAEEEDDLDSISNSALAYISEIFNYMKKRWKDDACTVPALMKELYRIASTGEYRYVQNLNTITHKSRVFEHLWKETGKKEVLYAARLLRHYYFLRERKYHSERKWKEVERVYEKMTSLEIPKKQDNVTKTKRVTLADSRIGGLSDKEFMQECRKHMDKYYIGQEVLKKKLCSMLVQWKYYGVRSSLLMIGPSGSGKNYMIETIRSFPELGMPVLSFDCSSLSPTGFSGADVSDIFKKIRQQAISFRFNNGLNGISGVSDGSDRYIVFLDEIDKIINSNHDSHDENVNAMVQQQLLSALAGTETIEGVDTSKILFILGGAFPRIDDLKKDRKSIGFNAGKECVFDIKESVREQMIAIGGEVEFVGRIEDIVKLSKLTREDLKAILMDEQIGAFTKKKELYEKSGLDLSMDEDMVDEIVDLIVKEDAGARSVKNIMNQFADNQYYYDMKVGGYSGMKIHKGMLYGETPIFYKKGKAVEIGSKRI